MDVLKKIFPLSFKCAEKNDFITSLVIYGVAAVVAAILIAVLRFVPVLSILVSLTGYLAEVYITAGIALSILVFIKVIKLN